MGQPGVQVVVQSADFFSGAGLTSCLSSSSEIVLLPEEQRVLADVVVTAVYCLDPEALADLHRTAVETPVPIVLVVNEIPEVDAVALVECRVVAILSRAAVTGDRLVRSVLAAAAEAATVPSNLVELLTHVRRLQQDLVTSSGNGHLTSREIKVLRLLADGLETAEIAGVLSYSERTVKNVLHGLMTRLNLRNRPHAVAYALRNGLI